MKKWKKSFIIFKALANCEIHHIDNYGKMDGTRFLSRSDIFCIDKYVFLLSQVNSNYDYRLLCNRKMRAVAA